MMLEMVILSPISTNAFKKNLLKIFLNKDLTANCLLENCTKPKRADHGCEMPKLILNYLSHTGHSTIESAETNQITTKLGQHSAL